MRSDCILRHTLITLLFVNDLGENALILHSVSQFIGLYNLWNHIFAGHDD